MTSYHALRELARQLWRRVYMNHRAVWMVCATGSQVPDIALPPGLEISLSERSGVITWLRRCGERWMADEQEFSVAEHSDHIYPCVRRDGEIVGYLKVAVGQVRVGDFQRTFELPAETAMIYDTYVVAAERGQGIAPALITATVQHMRARGVRWVVCHIPPGNRSSLRAYAKCGFRVLRMLHCRWIFGLKLPERGPRWLLRRFARDVLVLQKTSPKNTGDLR